MSIYYDERHVRIWRGYKIYARGAYTIRSGFELMGLSNVTPTHLDTNTNEPGHLTSKGSETIPELFYRRGESILEHAAKLAYLCTAFSSNFPGFFDDLRPCINRFYKPGTGIIEDWLIYAVALIHDAAEAFIGDIPDDGNPARMNKDEIELDLFEEKIAPAFSREDYLLIREFYRSFQKRDTPPGQALGSLDKTEAVLKLIWLEQYEAYGLVTSKPNPTGQDIHYMKFTGTPCATDCWAAHLKDRIKGFPEEITRHIFATLYVAVMDVRGEWFSWWDKK